LTHRNRLSLLAAAALTCFGVAAWALVGPAAGQGKPKTAPKVTVVNVTAGQPSELTFTLSKFSNLPVGKVMFKVTNKGAIAHNFKLCTAAVTSAKLFACAGKATPTIQPGKSATLSLTLKKGKFEFLCSVPGHASAGMKGLLGVGVKVPKPGASTTPVSSGGSTGGTGGTSGGTTTTAAKCTSPQSSTVTVSAIDFGYTVSPSTIPCGTVTINVKNTGNADHDFVIEGLIGTDGRTNVLGPGESQTISTSSLTPGSWTYYCSVPTHRSLGMEGKLIVTG
jgi:uncharacterized cupredoxin-like copper-binding protein